MNADKLWESISREPMTSSRIILRQNDSYQIAIATNLIAAPIFWDSVG